MKSFFRSSRLHQANGPTVVEKSCQVEQATAENPIEVFLMQRVMGCTVSLQESCTRHCHILAGNNKVANATNHNEVVWSPTFHSF